MRLAHDALVQIANGATWPDQLNVVRSLLNANPSILNSVDSDDRTALHWAAASGGLNIARELLTRDGIEVDKKDGAGWTAMMIAGTS